VNMSMYTSVKYRLIKLPSQGNGGTCSASKKGNEEATEDEKLCGCGSGRLFLACHGLFICDYKCGLLADNSDVCYA
jgi:hypothetical protein